MMTDREGIIIRLGIFRACARNESSRVALGAAISILRDGGDYRIDGEDLLVYRAEAPSDGIRVRQWRRIESAAFHQRKEEFHE